LIYIGEFVFGAFAIEIFSYQWIPIKMPVYPQAWQVGGDAHEEACEDTGLDVMASCRIG